MSIIKLKDVKEIETVTLHSDLAKIIWKSQSKLMVIFSVNNNDFEEYCVFDDKKELIPENEKRFFSNFGKTLGKRLLKTLNEKDTNWMRLSLSN